MFKTILTIHAELESIAGSDRIIDLPGPCSTTDQLTLPAGFSPDLPSHCKEDDE